MPPPPVSTGSRLAQACRGFFARIGAPSFSLPVSGTYRVLVYDDGRNDTGQYNLTVERVVPPPSSASPICYSQSPIETERIDKQGDLDAFTFPAKVDDRLEITVSNLGSDLIDPCVELFAPDGSRVTQGCGDFFVLLTPLLAQAGRYTILISDSGHRNLGPYALTLFCTGGPCEPCPTQSTCRGLVATIFGTDGNDTIMGTAGSDIIAGKEGDDLIYGRGGNDLICGDAGNDTIFGGNEDDQLFGGSGSDALFGEAGNDRLFGESGRDVLYGGLGLDRLAGGAGDDLLFGGADGDTLNGGSGNDICDNIADTIAAISCEISLNP